MVKWGCVSIFKGGVCQIGVMKMKKIILTVILTTSLLLTACSNIAEEGVHTTSGFVTVNMENIESAGIVGTSNSISYSNVQQMLEAADWGSGTLEDFSADLVVIGEFIGDTQAKLRKQYSEHFGKDVVFFADAFNELKIIEVLDGKADVGDILPIVQRYGIDEERKMFMSFDGMTPMHKGDRWIYFLKFDEYTSAYESLGLSDGRYPLPNKETVRATENFKAERNMESLDVSMLGVLSSMDFNAELYADVLGYFQIETQDWVNPGQSLDAKLIELAELANQPN